MKYIITILGAILVFGCGKKTNNENGRMKIDVTDVGALCTVNSGDGDYGVIKVLARDDQTIHIRLYMNKWSERPSSVESSELSLGSINDPGGFGIGHLPISISEYKSWAPVVIRQEDVLDDELEGYNMWKDAGGGSF
ncbi:hypothetical protein NT6N_24220 [Oceaniferula spumae]|uniref:Uncharacterized protein n=1 Tax=Oceaniferula spumae TaxID=2979115 RepID=A0AAT9FN94_9BACT